MLTAKRARHFLPMRPAKRDAGENCEPDRGADERKLVGKRGIASIDHDIDDDGRQQDNVATIATRAQSTLVSGGAFEEDRRIALLLERGR